MNSWQIAQEIRERLRGARWPREGAELVFGRESVYVVAGAPTEDGLPGSWPFALIFVGDGSADPDEPDLETVPFSIAVGVYQEGDPLGEQAVIGGPRAGARLGTSQGRGVLEVTSMVKRVVGDLSGFLGIPILYRTTGAPAVTAIERGAHLVVQIAQFEALCTGQPEPLGPYNVNVNGDTVDWNEAFAAAGLIHYAVVGSNGAIEHPSDGTILGTPTLPPFTDPSVSAWPRITVFAAYSWVEGTDPQVYSEAIRGTWRQ